MSYGRYERERYFNLLAEVEFVICLSESESQGLAMFEAWVRDVPTLIWNRGYWQGYGYKWKDEKISSPYLIDDCGMFFEDESEFKKKLSIFLSKISQFVSRKYAITNFNDEVVARKYLEILRQ